MPDLASRTEHEDEVALLILLYLQEIEASLREGAAPDWMNWTSRLSVDLAGLLAYTFREAAEQLVGDHDGWLADGQDRAQQWAGGRALSIAAGMANTTRDAIAAAQQRWARGTEFNYLSDLEWHFSQGRAESVAITETTNAISEGEHYGAAELAAIAIMLIPVFVTEEDDRVCPICSPLNRERQNVWQSEFPTGPPCHPNCRCRLEWVRV